MNLGELVGWMHGANAPLMKQTVDRIFENEVKVKVFKITFFDFWRAFDTTLWKLMDVKLLFIKKGSFDVNKQIWYHQCIL